MYAVTAAGGQLGRHTVEALLERGVPAEQVVAIVRTPAKVADLADRGVVVRTGDYNHAADWTAALEGVDTLLLVSGLEFGKRLDQHTTVIEAAKAAGVGRVVYTSILKADTSTSLLTPEHLATEQALQASGLTYTILRNSWYFENYLDRAGQFLTQGALISSAGATPFTAATRADYAAAAAATMVESGHDDAIYELGGTEKITTPDVAAQISAASGTEVAYHPVTADEQRQILLGAGVPAEFVDLGIDIDRVTGLGELDTDSDDLARLVGRPLTSFADATKTAVAALH